ncbi:MAG: 4Fe4S-binding leucine-rich repeat protein, partial [Bradyrhizobium sp.]|nr:4Fe4S-binding leucine-rich repeat protein [Bradyrhizobium sp.]
MSDDIDEAIDWQGHEISCAGCAHEQLSAAGGCRLRHACVHDRYARRIDRFFNWNPALANDYVKHPHFEVRAIAAKHASPFYLPPLLDDPEETVRWNAARRLPKRLVLRLRHDPHREVRIRIATVLDPEDLMPMMMDDDYYVRLVVARRIV